MKEKMLFLFDYGDDWMFEVELIGVLEPEDVRYPQVTEEKGIAPKQYD